MTPDDPRHGTYAGYCAHRYHGVPACAPCIEARNEYKRQWRAADPERGADEQRRNRARERALWRLSRLHPEDFHRLYLEEVGPPLMTVPTPQETP